MNDNELEFFYRERLEEDIISELHNRRDISYEEAMHLYYKSQLAKYISLGLYGIQYLDANILTDLLEKELQGHQTPNIG